MIKWFQIKIWRQTELVSLNKPVKDNWWDFWTAVFGILTWGEWLDIFPSTWLHRSCYLWESNQLPAFWVLIKQQEIEYQYCSVCSVLQFYRNSLAFSPCLWALPLNVKNNCNWLAIASSKMICEPVFHFCSCFYKIS